MNISQTPAPWRKRIGWILPSQSLNDPTKLTRLALGAQNANPTPEMPSNSIG